MDKETSITNRCTEPASSTTKYEQNSKRTQYGKDRHSRPKADFITKAKKAALLESVNVSQISTSKRGSPNRSFLFFNAEKLNSVCMQTQYIEPHNPNEPQHVIHSTNKPHDFMMTSPDSPPVNASITAPPTGNLTNIKNAQRKQW